MQMVRPATDWRRNVRAAFESIFCVAVLAALPVLIFLPMVGEGLLPWPADALYFMAPWEQARPLDLDAPRNVAEDEFVLRFYPWYAFLHDSAQRGESLLWNPYEGGGIPFFALWRTRCLSPFSAPLYFMPLDAGLRLMVLAKLVVAGFCAYYAGRRFALSKAAALLAAITFQLGTVFVLWPGNPVSDTAAWFPLLLVYVDGLITFERNRWGLGAFTIALMLLGGAPEALAGALVCCVGFLVAQSLHSQIPLAQGFKSIASLGIVAVLGCGLAAIQIVPFVEFVREAGPGGGGSGVGALWGGMSAIFFPPARGAVEPVVADSTPIIGQKHIALWHFGWVIVALLPLWFAVRPFLHEAQRRRTESLAAGGLAAFVLGALVIEMGPAALPVDEWGLHQFAYVLPFTLALLVGSAVDEWALLDPDETHRAVRRIAVGYPVLIAIAAAVGLLHAGAVSGISVLLSAACVVIVIVLLGWTLLRPSGRVLGYALAMLVALNLAAVHRPALTFSDGDAFYPRTDFIDALAERGGRINGTEALARWPLSGNFLADFYGSKIRLERHAAFLEQIGEHPLLLRRTGSPNLLLTKGDIQETFAAVRPMLRVGHVFASGAVLFDDLGTASRARMAYQVRPASAFDAAALRPGAAPIVEAAESFEQGEGPTARPSIAKPERYDHVRIHVAETKPGTLILSDSYYPGWKASVDGKTQPVFPVDGMFRGVHLGRGIHEVVFYYAPWSLRVGMIVSGGTLGLMVLAGGYFVIRTRRDD